MRRVVVHRDGGERTGRFRCVLGESRWLPGVLLLNRLFDLDRLAAELARENFRVLGLREDVHLLAVGTANGQFALRVEGWRFPVVAHLLDFLTPLSDLERKTGAGTAIRSLRTPEAGI